jgi:cytochrome d ubiquinol oxidase subunit II
MLAMHGAIYLNLKTEGALQCRVQVWLPRLMGLFAALAVASTAGLVVVQHSILAVYWQVWPLVFPFGGAAALFGAWLMARRGRDALAFACSAAMIALLLFSVAVGLFPNLLLSTIDPSYSLTVFNAASGAYTLQVMLVVALIGMPFVLTYLAGVNYLFRGKVRLSSHSY